ncbi:hypothetical protein BJ973_001935 [Actinoplanes tereljensis]|uniref:Uncharacterized protein n=1 Tax=Paractinoplanes tereljensis TaxID=571912 RepID=A0A919NL39_9ACTN|nr:hypothetical protein [Actinoplanes tereljensis]GIF20158.1 hypothetical protein Ate02nite_28880 [Actinoplanes tereljensis]
MHFVRSDHEPPSPEQMLEWQRRISPPENELPAGAGITALLSKTDDTAVGISQVEVYSTGFRFTLAVRLRVLGPEVPPGSLFALVGGHGHPGLPVAAEDRLLFGIEYADGARASTLEDFRMLGPGVLSPLTLTRQGGGSSGDLSANQTFWVSPLPPAGPVTFVLAWPAFGITESRTEVDGEAIRAAADRSTLLWPPQPPVEPTPPPPPVRPATGWFASEDGDGV